MQEPVSNTAEPPATDISPSSSAQAGGSVVRVLTSVGEGVVSVSHELGRVLMLLVRVTIFTVSRPVRVREVVRLIDLFGIRSLPLVLFAGLSIGLLCALQNDYVASFSGARHLMGAIVSLELVRQWGPLVAAVLVTVRNASTITCELAVMRRSSHFNALLIMGIDPLDYLVVPRVWTMVLITPALTLVFECAGMVGAYLVCLNWLGIDDQTFLYYLRQHVRDRGPVIRPCQSPCLRRVDRSCGLLGGMHSPWRRH